MSKRWRIAGLMVAAVVFALTLADPTANKLPVLSDTPPIVHAAVWAILAFVWIWLLEAAVGFGAWLVRLATRALDH